MGLFNFGKKKEEKVEASSCCCNGNADTFEASAGSCCEGSCGINSIKVLGAGCKSCHEQYEYTKAVIEAMGLSAEVEYITDMKKVMRFLSC